MYRPRLSYDKNKVPILKAKDIDVIAERMLLDYNPKLLKKPQAVDVEDFAFNYLKLKQDFQYLSNSGLYLGMLVFNNTSKIPVYVPEVNRAEYISARAGTIIVDNSLIEDGQENRYRFTIGHECFHDIFHFEYYGAYNENQITFLDEVQKPLICCRAVSAYKEKNKRVWTDVDFMEYQANQGSAALLMPETTVRLAVEELKQTEEDLLFLAYNISEIFKVSQESARYRLKHLGII